MEAVSAYDDQGKDKDENGFQPSVPYGYMEVTHWLSQEKPNYDEGFDMIDVHGNARDYQPTELFTHVPAKTTIDMAFTDPRLRHTQPIMGAYLAKKYGELTASSSLTNYSSRLTRGALRRGLPVKTSSANPTAEKTSTEDAIYYREEPIPHNVGNEIPKSDIYEAKNYLRELLGRKKPLSNQFDSQVEQPKLPGMENF